MKGAAWGGGILVFIGALIAALVLLNGSRSPDGWIADHYARSGDAWTTQKDPLAAADELSDEFRPVDRVVDPSGVFLRYPEVIVAVLAAGAGSKVYVDRADVGYQRWHKHVGGRWGGPAGHATLFRGGGPGDGK
ncbi:DUF4247 domain-containing protein [Actinocorallia sp. A-T 12471]|uniref:DUF4247 domain-containing protein n=1 Tax=Actinocorallia sp. A-T 12471 TaxID=3089813 RepID=UPI0029D3AB87|nr:DUF4247 domain-containing protein [Actinocorallia sp. A-T 12471]MDX6738683.1 DUF4247 domain-containing protein [Actinocorallia sp. A-T 12471]